MAKKNRFTEDDIRMAVNEVLSRLSVETDKNSCLVNEDMTRGQIDDMLGDLMKSREFEKRVNNIVVDTLGDFLENMWTKKSFWKTMLKKK